MLMASGCPTMQVNACLRLDGEQRRATPSNLEDSLPYDSTSADQRGVTLPRFGRVPKAEIYSIKSGKDDLWQRVTT